MLSPPWQYSIEPFSNHLQSQELAAAIRSDENIRTALAISRDDGDENMNTIASTGARAHTHVTRSLTIPNSQNQPKLLWLDLQTLAPQYRQPQTELKHTQGPLSDVVVSHNFSEALPDLKSNPERAVSEKGTEPHTSNVSATDSKATSNLTVDSPLKAGEEISQPQVQNRSDQIRAAFARGDEETAFAIGAQNVAPDARARRVQLSSVASYRGESDPPVEGEQPDSERGIDVPEAGLSSRARSNTQSSSSTSSEFPPARSEGIPYSRSSSNHAQF